MSMEDWKVKLEAAAEASDDPALEGVVKVARAVEKGQRETDARLTNFESKIDETQKKTAEAIGKVDTKIEALGKEVCDQLDAMKTRGLAIGLLSGSNDPSRELLNAIPEADRKFVQVQDYRGTAPTDRGSLFADPVFRGAAEAWFRHSTMAQLSKFAAGRGEHVEAVVKLGNALNDIYAKAAYSPTDANGGYGIPDPVAAEVLRIAHDSSVALQVARQIPMSGDTLYVPHEFANFTTYWSAAAATLTGGENTFSRNTLSAKKLIARATAASEAVDDIVFNLLGYVREVMGERIGEALDTAVFEDTGTNFTGLNADISTSGNTIATTTTDGEALVYSDLAKAVYKAKFASTRQNAAFVMAPAVWSTIVALADTTGQAIFQYAAVPNTPPERILGFPVYLCSPLSVAITRGSTGNTGNVYFGPMKKLLLGVRKGLAWSVTDQVNWATDSIDCRMIGRFGFTVGTPGAFTRIVGCLTT